MRIPKLSPTSRTGILVAALFMLGVSSAMEQPHGELEFEHTSTKWTAVQNKEKQQDQFDNRDEAACSQKS